MTLYLILSYSLSTLFQSKRIVDQFRLTVNFFFVHIVRISQNQLKLLLMYCVEEVLTKE